jgi:hypothetical protein
MWMHVTFKQIHFTSMRACVEKRQKKSSVTWKRWKWFCIKDMKRKKKAAKIGNLQNQRRNPLEQLFQACGQPNPRGSGVFRRGAATLFT